MARESLKSRRERIHRTLALLDQTYPDAHCELVFDNPLQLLIATILSAQCTDVMVNRVTRQLFQDYRTAADFAQASQEEMEHAIRGIGLFRAKAKNIRACCQKLLERHDGYVPQTMEELVALDGVGRKTANVVLGNAFYINHGVVVDTHVARLCARLGWSRGRSPEAIEKDLMKLVPNELWTQVSHWLIWHGRRCCKARRPLCQACPLREECPTVDRHG